MSERWRQPVIPIAVDKETNRIEVTIGGVNIPRLRENVRLVLRDEDVVRIKTGYVCINCLEPFESAYPVQCAVCKYPVRTRQAKDFSESYEGTEPELRDIEDIRAQFRWDDMRKEHMPGSSVLLPKGVSSASS